MAWIESPFLTFIKGTIPGKPGGPGGGGYDWGPEPAPWIYFEYVLKFGDDDVSLNSWYKVHVTLWKLNGSMPDHIETRHNGGTLTIWREHTHKRGGDTYIGYLDGQSVQPNGATSIPLGGSKSLSVIDTQNEFDSGEYYLHIVAHPWSGGDAEAYSNVDSKPEQ